MLTIHEVSIVLMYVYIRARLHTGKFSWDKKISFVLNPLVAHESSQNKEISPVQEKFSCVQTGLYNVNSSAGETKFWTSSTSI